MQIDELLLKPVWQMTGEEFLYLHRHASQKEEARPQTVTDTERKYVYEIHGISQIFGCSLPTANRIKKSGKIRLTSYLQNVQQNPKHHRQGNCT